MRDSFPSSSRGDLQDDLSSSDEGSGLDLKEDSEGWDDVESDVEAIEVKDFFSDETFPSAKAMLDHCRTSHGFDFLKVQRELGLDFLGSAKLANFVRKLAQEDKKPPDPLLRDLFDKDEFLQPTLENDALLFSLDDVIQEPEVAHVNGDHASQDDEIALLRQRLSSLEAQFSEYRAEVAKTLDDRWSANEAPNGLPNGSSSNQNSKRSEEEYDQGYFTTYSYNDIHQVMLQDSVRTDAYRDFIYGNKHLFKDKVVLDVGCGTGILSMFCAKAGAAKVVAVDNSDIIIKTQSIIHSNGLDAVVTCVKGKIEEVSLPEGIGKVDVIVSEWMGYGLLFEAMLDSVLFARDRYLKPDGLMVPSHCTLHLGALHDEVFMSENFSFWEDVYGFKMTAMMEKIYDDVLVTAPDASAIAGRTDGRLPFKVLDLHTVKSVDLDFVSSFRLTIDNDTDHLDGFCVWFDTIFLTSRERVVPDHLLRGSPVSQASMAGDVFFSTGPFSKTTHWQCGLCIIDQKGSRDSSLRAGSTVEGSITFAKDKKEKRALNIKIAWQAADANVGGQQGWALR